MNHKVSRRQGLLAFDHGNSDNIALFEEGSNTATEMLSLDVYLSFIDSLFPRHCTECFIDISYLIL